MTNGRRSWTHERGIVICGGGWRFFPSLFVTVACIRRVGCRLPIQVWYLGDRGEFDVRMAQALAPFVVDKSRHWKPLWLTAWMNDYSDYVYKHVYGDTDTFHLCWRFCGHDVCVPTQVPGWHVCAFIQKDFDGRCLFCHRTRDKFRWSGGQIDGHDVANVYMTGQWFGQTQRVAGLPHEDFAHDMLRYSDELLRPELYFQFIDGPRGWCRDVWDGVARDHVEVFAALRSRALPRGIPSQRSLHAHLLGAEVIAMLMSVVWWTSPERVVSIAASFHPSENGTKRDPMNPEIFVGRCLLLKNRGFHARKAPPSPTRVPSSYAESCVGPPVWAACWSRELTSRGWRHGIRSPKMNLAGGQNSAPCRVSHRYPRRLLYLPAIFLRELPR